MAQAHDQITEEIQQFIAEQQMFFVATAPLSADGHVNLSPKGLDTFRIISPTEVAYLDFTGSGNETSAHLLENGRITFLFCSFKGKPKILRLYGKGQTILPDHEQWPTWRARFPEFPGVRQVLVVTLDRVQTSCGFGIPLYDYVGQRDRMPKWAVEKGEEGLEAYQQKKNLRSIDALPTPLAQKFSRVAKGETGTAR
jgi:hypothetical protein